MHNCEWRKDNSVLVKYLHFFFLNCERNPSTLKHLDYLFPLCTNLSTKISDNSDAIIKN